MKAKRNKSRIIFLCLLVLTLLIIVVSARYGALKLDLNTIFSAIEKYFLNEKMSLNERIFFNLRLPRSLLCVFVGMALAVGGTLLQGLFRNPIIEPGLIGTSSGAALGAALYFVLGVYFKFNAGEWTLPIVACVGGLLATGVVFLISGTKSTGKNSTIELLLVGIAVNALCLSGVGFLSYIARDPQARSITFWSMGSLSGANWIAVFTVGIVTSFMVLLALRYAKHLNSFVMGEEEAYLMGINVQKVKLFILLINIIMVSVATAFVGVISFVGLIVPHLLRILNGSDNRYLIPCSALLGGFLLAAADLVARLAVSPAELPIGIVTSIIGVPIFILLLKRNSYKY